MGIIANQPNRDIAAGVPQQLTAHEKPVAVVDVYIVRRVTVKSVALDVNAVETGGQRRAQGPRDAARQAVIIVIAICSLGVSAEIELGLF